MITFSGRDAFISYRIAEGELFYAPLSQGRDEWIEAQTIAGAREGRGIARLEQWNPQEPCLYTVGRGPFLCFPGREEQGTFSFGFLGDTQADPDTEALAMGELLAHVSDEAFLLIAGDLVNNESDISEWEAFFAQSKGLFTRLPVMPAVGNHDSRIDIPSTEGLSGFYGFDYGNLHVLVLNGNLLGSSDEKTIAAIGAFFAQDLQNSADAKWRIAMMHYPLFPVSNNPTNIRRGDNMLAQYGPYLTQYDLLLCGHEHVYSRLESDGLLQVMGNASEKVYAPSKEGLLASYRGPVYTRFNLTDDTLEAVTINKEGNTVDAFVLRKGK